jgi:hypothetical protein
MSCIQEQPTEGVPSKCQRKWPDQTTGQHLASVLQEGRENANIDAGLGLIWRICLEAARKVS